MNKAYLIMGYDYDFRTPYKCFVNCDDAEEELSKLNDLMDFYKLVEEDFWDCLTDGLLMISIAECISAFGYDHCEKEYYIKEVEFIGQELEIYKKENK